MSNQVLLSLRLRRRADIFSKLKQQKNLIFAAIMVHYVRKIEAEDYLISSICFSNTYKTLKLY